MSALNRLSFPNLQLIDGDGNPMVGAKIYFYESGTSNLKDTYADSAFATVNANPLTANAKGTFTPIFLQRGEYRIVINDADGQLYQELDPVRYGYSNGFIDASTTSQFTISDNLVDFNRGTKVVMEGDIPISAATTANAGIYDPILRLEGRTDNSAAPAIEFLHNSTGFVERRAAIGSRAGKVEFYTSDFFGGTDRVLAASIGVNGAITAETDNLADLGRINNRFDDIYATNGTIQTCDENLKGNIDANPDVDWEYLEAAKPITHTRDNAKRGRRHTSWPARQMAEKARQKDPDLQNHAEICIGRWEEPTGVYDKNGKQITKTMERYGLRPAELSAKLHLHLLDLKQTVVAMAARIEELEGAAHGN